MTEDAPSQLTRQRQDEEHRAFVRENLERWFEENEKLGLNQVQGTIRIRMLIQAPYTLHLAVKQACEYAGAHDPEGMARKLILATQPRSNSHDVDNRRSLSQLIDGPDPDSMPDLPKNSEYSRELTQNMNRLRFQEAIETTLSTSVAGMLQAFPPDDENFIYIGDGHEKDYSSGPPPVGVKLDPDDRRAHGKLAVRGNAKYPYCTYYLGGIVVWFHKGQPVVCPVQLHHPQPGLEETPKAHANLILDAVSRLPKRPSAIVLDSWYDGLEARRTIREAGYVCVVRMQVGESTDRHIRLKDGPKTTICSIANDLLHDETAEIRRYEERDDFGEPIYIEAKQVIVEGRLGKDRAEDDANVEVLIRIVLKPGLSGPEINWNRFMAVIMDGPKSIRPVKFLYQYRWRVEVIYHQLALLEADFRCQKIASEHIQFLVQFLQLAMALMIQCFLKAGADERRRFGPVRVDVVSARSIVVVLADRV